MPNFKKNPTPFMMKNSALHASAKYGSPMQANYSSPMTKPTLGEWWKKTKLGRDLKALGTRMQDAAANIQHSTPKSRSKSLRKGFENASAENKKLHEKRSEQINKLKNRLFISREK